MPNLVAYIGSVAALPIPGMKLKKTCVIDLCGSDICLLNYSFEFGFLPLFRFLEASQFQIKFNRRR
jgi:hypothetical protein